MDKDSLAATYETPIRMADMADQQDHIYEIMCDLEQQLVVDVGDEKTSSTLQRPPPPPDHESLDKNIKKQKRRLQVMTEIVCTEKDFLTALTVTIDDIMNNLKGRVVDQTTIATLFGNIEEVREFSDSFHNELKDALECETGLKDDPDAATIGQVFIDNIQRMLQVFTTYCKNHDDSIAMLEKCESDQEFTLAVDHCLGNVKTKVDVFSLGSFLIKPVQRVLKYPLLIGELIKLTDRPASHTQTACEFDKLLLAAKMMKGVASHINDSKRTKDLLGECKNAKCENLGPTKSKKKLKGNAARIPKCLDNPHQFAVVEKQFRTLEHALKSFKNNAVTYCDRCHDALHAELSVAKAIVDMATPDRTLPVAQYYAVLEKMSGPIYRQFHGEVQRRVLSPISSLLATFEDPRVIIEGRNVKLTDFERLKKNSTKVSTEKIQAAKQDYEALNNRLLDELPKLCQLGSKLLSSCTAIFVQVLKDFEKKQVDVLKPLLMTIQRTRDREPTIQSNIEIQDKFHSDHAEAVNVISRLQIVPGSFGALFEVNRSPSYKQKNEKSEIGSRTSLEGSSSPSLTSSEQKLPQARHALQQSHNTGMLYVALPVINASQPMGASPCKGVESNSSEFLPHSLIGPYSISKDTRAASSPPPYSRSQATTAPKQRSSTFGNFGGTSRGLKPQPSLFTVREEMATLSKGRMSPIDSKIWTDSDFIQVFAEEEEIFDGTEYDELLAARPKSTKQHFRVDYKFTAGSALQLTVHAGDIVKLIMPHDTDGNTEWWFVSNNEGEQGYVPSNYLTKAE